MTEPLLLLRWNAGELSVTHGTVVTIGRAPDNTVVLASTAVSRYHVRIAGSDNGGWVVTDLGSTQGTFLDGERLGELAVAGPLDVMLGQGSEAVVVSMLPGGTADSGGFEPTRANGGRLVTPPQTEPDADTRVVAVPGGAQRPGGALSPARAPATVVPETSDAGALTLLLEGATHRLRPGLQATIGREDDNSIVVSEPTVSRHHVRIEHDGRGWLLLDLGSSSGTWHHGARAARFELSGSDSFVLGERTSGLAVEVTAPRRDGSDGRTPSAAPDRSRRALVPLVAGVVALGLVAGGALWATRSGDGLDKDLLARATVQVVTDAGSGSGSVIDSKLGLILTNAHVAAPAASGTGVRDFEFSDEVAQERNPRLLTINVSPGVDRGVRPAFRAQVVAVDGYLDLAVLKIVQTVSASNNTIETADLEELSQVELGDSADLGSGDAVLAIGYPGAAESSAPTFTEGVISGVVSDDRLRTNRAYLNIDASISFGNSGGLAADEDGRLIGVPTLGRTNPGKDVAVLGSMRPIALAMPLIEAARKGTSYTSPWTTEVPSDAAKVTDVRYTGPDTPREIGAGCSPGSPSAGTPSFAVDYSGFPNGPHLDVFSVLADPTTGKTIAFAYTEFATAFPGSGCMTMTMKASKAVQPGSYVLRIGVGANYTLLYDDEIEYTPGASSG